MSMPELSALSAQLTGRLGGTPPADGSVRLGQIVTCDHLWDSPPTVTVGDAEVQREMRVSGNIWDYHPGDTVVWTEQTGSPLVVGVLPVVGSEIDFADDEFDPWHEIGAAGEPAFENSWVNFDGGTTYNTAGYWMQSDGWVRLKGLVKDGTATLGTTIFDLPFGWAPPWDCYFVVSSNGNPGLIEVDQSGNVKCFSVNNTYVSLDNITFPAGLIHLGTDDTKVNPGRWGVPQYNTGWINGTTTDGEIETYTRHDGWTWIRGTLDVQAIPGNGLVLPEEAAPGYKAHIFAAMAFGISRHDVGGSSSVRNPRLWRVESGGGIGEHFIGGLNWFSRMAREAHHEIRGTGLPFQNSWVNFANDHLLCRYRKDHHGVVHLWGLAQGNASTADTICTLPVGFRPLKRTVFNSMFNTGGVGRVDVLPNGEVLAVNHPNNTWATLSGGMCFRAMQ